MATNMTQNIIANFYFQLEPNKYIMSEKTGWYEYNKNNVLIPRGTKPPASLLNHMAETLQSIFFHERNKRNPPPKGAPPEAWAEFKNMPKIIIMPLKLWGRLNSQRDA
jgi:hypothetical protein